MILLLIAFAFAAGIALGSALGGPAVLALLLAALAMGFLLRRRGVVPCLLAALCAGLPEGAGLLRQPMPDGGTVAVEGCVAAPVEPLRDGRTQILLRLDSGHRLAVTTRSGEVTLLPGDCVRMRAHIHPPVGFLNPDQPSVALMAEAHGIDRVASVASSKCLVSIGRHAPAWHWRIAGRLRARLGEFLRTALPAGNPRGLLLALSLGIRGEVTAELEDALRRVGVVHVLSVSGLHLAAVAWLFYGGVRRLLLWIAPIAVRVEVRRLAAALSIPAVWAYSALTGAALSTCRSALMATLYFLAVVLGRQSSARASLGAAALILLALSPASLFDPSFALTFAATGGLVLLAPRWAGPGSGSIRKFLASSAAALVATLPLGARFFHEVAVAGLLGNLVIAPLCELAILPLCLVTLVLVPVSSPLAALLVALPAALARAMSALALAMAHHVPTWHLATPTLLAMGFFYAFLAAATVRQTRWALLAGSALVMSIAVPWLLRRSSADLIATFLDVGQGDAIVLELPHARTLLIDGGGSFDPGFDPGERVIEPFLRSRGIDRLDLVILTHPHPDHMNGLVTVLDRFDVGEFWECGEPASAAAYAGIQKLVGERHIAHGPPGSRRFGEVELDVLGPRGGARWDRSTNDNSLVVRLRYAGRALLFPGDIERAAESELVQDSQALRADILKAPHHGSRTSSTTPFLAAVAPGFAVFPAGRDNHFGFPHRDVLDRYPCPTRTTGTDGAVTVTVRRDGQVKVHTVMEPEERKLALPD